jgi:ribosome-associated protein
MIVISNSLSIPEGEVRFTFSRSGGPGGQNVNKLNTRATLWFDINASESLTGRQRELIRARLANRINEAGILSVSSSSHRTQKANREDALRRFQDLLAGATRERRHRKRTKVPRRAREKRLREKKHRSRIKELRSKNGFES